MTFEKPTFDPRDPRNQDPRNMPDMPVPGLEEIPVPEVDRRDKAPSEIDINDISDFVDKMPPPGKDEKKVPKNKDGHTLH